MKTGRFPHFHPIVIIESRTGNGTGMKTYTPILAMTIREIHAIRGNSTTNSVQEFLEMLILLLTLEVAIQHRRLSLCPPTDATRRFHRRATIGWNSCFFVSLYECYLRIWFKDSYWIANVLSFWLSFVDNRLYLQNNFGVVKIMF